MMFCMENDVPWFKNCESTVTFIRNMNDLFDILYVVCTFVIGLKIKMLNTNVWYYRCLCRLG